MQQTSLLAYRSLERVGLKQKRCYEVIQRASVSNYDIAKALGWEINRVTPRVKELRELGLVEEAYRDKHPITERTVIFWKVKEEQI